MLSVNKIGGKTKVQLYIIDTYSLKDALTRTNFDRHRPRIEEILSNLGLNVRMYKNVDNYLRELNLFLETCNF